MKIVAIKLNNQNKQKNICKYNKINSYNPFVFFKGTKVYLVDGGTHATNLKHFLQCNK